MTEKSKKASFLAMLPNNPIVAQVLLTDFSTRKNLTTDNTDGHGSEKTKMSASLYPCSSALSVVRNLVFSRLCVGSGGPRRLDRTLRFLEILIRFVHSCPNAVVVELPRHPRPAARSRDSGLAIIAHHSCPSFQMTEKSKKASFLAMLPNNPIVAQVLLTDFSTRKNLTTDNTDGHGSEKTRTSACLYQCSSALSEVRNLVYSRLCVGSGGPRRLDRTLQFLEILIRFVHSCPSFQMTEKSKWARNFPMLRKNSHSCPNTCDRLFNQKEFRLG